MLKATKILFLNQMAGPLFRELAEDLALEMPSNSTLLTGHPDTLALGSSTSKLLISKAPTYNRRSKLFRVLSWINYSLFAFWKMLKADSNTLIFIVSNPPFLGFFALLVNLVKRTHYVVLVYDIHPDTLISFGVLSKNSFAVKLWRSMNRRVWNRSIAVYTIGSVMAENLTKQFNVERTKLGHVGVIPPWADTNKIKPIDKNDNPLSRELGQEDKITILYSGNMGISHDIDSILQAAKILKNEENIAFLLIGEGEKWQDAVDFQKDNNLTNLQVLPFQPEKKLPYTMSLADIALVALDDGAEGLMIPSKMFYYMAAGAAVIGICKGRNDVSNIIQNTNCGITIEPKKPEELAAIIKELSKDTKKLRKFKECARKSSVSNFSRNACMEKLNQELLPMIRR
jgi:glycosyltransferase involved in cell wall biosynthesis